MKFLYLSALLCFFTLMGNAQNQPEQNCINGIPVCQSGYSQSNTYLGPGTIIELNSTNQGCLLSGEVNCVWYIIQVSVSGQLALSITPNNLSNDYDFAVWNITANGCQDIYNGTPPIACNYSGNAGATGLSSTNMGAQWSPTISVTAGQTLALNVSNFSQTNQSGYVLNFTASTASIFDNVPPSFSTAAAPCGYAADSLDVTISESVKCSSIASNGSNFSLLSGAPGTTGPAGTTIVSATGLNCSPNTTLTRTIRLKFSAPLPPGTYKLKPKLGTAGTTLQDPCNNNVVTGASADSVIFTMTPPLTRLYVDSAANTGGTGESWASPLKSLNAALALANTGCANEIWVRKGTYFPMESATAIASSRDSSFRILRNGVKLYGGFAGTETALSQRNLTLNTTTLSGDIGTPGVATDNAKHVVTVLAPAGSTFNATTTLNGFTITGGNANVGTGTPFTYNGLPVPGDSGGGIFCGANGSGSAVNMLIEDCLISGNYAEGGGGLYSSGSGSAPVALHCTFAQNTTNLQGGALFVSAGIFTSNNCVFAGNSAAAVGSVAHIAAGSTAAFNNSTLYNGSPFTGVALSNAGTAALNNTILWGANAAQVTGGGVLNAAYSDVIGIAAAGTNISANPQFVSPANAIGPDGIWGTTDDGLRLTPCSPAINAGSNALLPAGITTDFTGAPRIQSTAVEMGAYEMPFSVLPPSVTSISRSPAGTVCGNTPIVFTATTVPAGGGATYQWFKNGVAVGTAQSTYTFSSWSNGDAVWVVNTNSTCGGSDTSAKEIIPVTPSPQITNATGTNPTSCNGTDGFITLSGNFTAGTSYTINHIKNGTAQAAVILAGSSTGTLTLAGLSAGTYTAITVTRATCTSAAFALPVVLTAPLPPAAPVASANSPVCAGSTLSLSAAPITGATYNWSGPNSFAATGQAPTIPNIQAAGAGTYSVTATVAGCVSAAGTTTVVVNTIPATPGTITGPTAPCTNTSQVYSVAPVAGATTYAWVLPNGWSGTSTTASITVTTGANSGTVSVSAGNNCGASAAQSVAVAPGSVPAAPGAISGNAVPCIGTPQTYSVAPVAGALSYSWSAPAGWSGSSASNTITYTSFVQTGTVQVVANNICGSSAPAILSVSPSPVVMPSVTIVTGPNFCQSAPKTFTAVPVNGGQNPVFAWKKNGLPVGTNSPTYTDPAPATGDAITVEMTSSAPCATPSVVTAPVILVPTVNTAPVTVPGININIYPSTVLCAGAPTTFVTNIVGGGPTPAYKWYKNGVLLPGITTPNYTTGSFANGDTFSVVLLSSASCPLSDTVRSNKVGVTVIPNVLPTVTVSASGGTNVPAGTLVTFSATVMAAAGSSPFYQWYKNSIPIAQANNSTYTTGAVADGDAFWVRVSNLGPCATPGVLLSEVLKITVPMSVGPVVNSTSTTLRLYPNPNGGRFMVSADWKPGAAGEQVQLELINTLGQVMYRKTIVPAGSSWSTEIELAADVASGLYLLKLERRGDGSSTTRSVLIAR